MTRKLGFFISSAAIAVAAPALAQNQQTQPQQTPSFPSIAYGQTVQGEIAAPAGGCAADPRVRAYQFHADANSRIEITMNAEAFDTVVELGRYNGCEFESLASNDDGSGPEDGLNSRLTARIREAGDYVIHARSLGEDGHGTFNLALNRLPPPAGDPTPMALTIGREVRGRITANDPLIDNDADSIVESGRPYHLYALSGAAGQTVRLALDSNEFDPVIDVGSMSPLGYSVAMTNDDGGGEGDGLNSRLNITFRTAGTVIVRVSPLGNDTGRYTLEATNVR